MEQKTILLKNNKMKSLGISIGAILLIIVLVLSVMQRPQGIKRELFDSSNALRHIEELTQEKYEGRLVGTEGNNLAVKYIADQLKEMGIQPLSGQDYLLPYTTVSPQRGDKPVVKLHLGDDLIELERGKNFIERLGTETGNGEAKAEIYYIDDEYKLVRGQWENIENKILLIDYSLYKDHAPDKIDYFAHLKKAAGIIYLEKGPLDDHIRLGGKLDYSVNEIPKIGVTEDIFAQIVESIESQKETIGEISVSYTYERKALANNVAGIIPGKGLYKDEILILSTSIDSLGVDYDGEVFDGALKSTSGTGVLLELAKLIKENENPRKTVMVAFYNGAHTGYTGSKNFLHLRLLPKSGVQNIHIESIGAKDSNFMVETINSRGERKLTTLLASSITDVLYENNGIENIRTSLQGEHYNFTTWGIPSVTVKGISQQHILNREDKIEMIDNHTLSVMGKELTDVINDQLYHFEIFSSFVPPLIKTLPFIIILAALIFLKFYFIRSSISNSFVDKITKNPVICYGGSITVVIYIIALQAYLYAQQFAGTYNITASDYGYMEILNYAAKSIFPISLMLLGQVMILLLPFLTWILIYFATDKKIKDKYVLSISIVVLIVTNYFAGNKFFDHAAMTILPQVLKFDYSNIIIPSIFAILSLAGLYTYYLETKKDSVNHLIIVFTVIFFTLIAVFYSPYFMDPAAIHQRQVFKTMDPS